MPPPGSIVACWFPYHETPTKPGPDLRPALIVGRRVDDLAPLNSPMLVFVVYGTGQRTTDQNAKLGPYEMCVDPSEYSGTGLEKETLFDFQRIVPLFYDRTWFEAWGGRANPRLGHFPAGLMSQARKLRDVCQPKLSHGNLFA